jgi:acetyl esterase/lipase
MIFAWRAAWVVHWIVGLVMLSACSPVSLLNALAPTAGITETLDVPYGPGERHGLDIYAPHISASHICAPHIHARPGQVAAPVVMFIYGGGWKDGDKGNYRFAAASLAAHGFLTVVPDYRLFPQVRFPVFLRDNAEALAWIKNNIARYGGDPRRIFLMGHSAGAYNMAMLTLDKQWLAAYALDPDRDLSGAIGLAGPYDFLPLHDPELEDIFAPAGDLRLSQPITFARGDAPPMLLAAGTADRTVLSRNTEHLAAAIGRNGGRVEQRLYPGVNHTKIIGAMARGLRWLAPTMADALGFLRQQSGHEARVPGVRAGNPTLRQPVPVETP